MSGVLPEDQLTLLELLFFRAIAVLNSFVPKGESVDEALLEGRKGLKNGCDLLALGYCANQKWVGRFLEASLTHSKMKIDSYPHEATTFHKNFRRKINAMF